MLLTLLFEHIFKIGMKNKGIGKIYLLDKHLAVGEMPSHNHQIANYVSGNESNVTVAKMHVVQTIWQGKCEGRLLYIENAGSNKYHNNLQPSHAVYRFRRIA